VEEVKRTPSDHRMWYFHVERDTPAALFADVDMDSEDFFGNGEGQLELVSGVLEVASQVFASVYGRELLPEGHRLAVFTATTPTKLSLHLHMPDVVFPDVEEQKHFWREVEATARRSEAAEVGKLFWWTRKGVHRFAVDDAVYRQGAFRLPFQRKHGKDNTLLPLRLEVLRTGDELELLEVACPTGMELPTTAILPRVFSNEGGGASASDRMSRPLRKRDTKDGHNPQRSTLIVAAMNELLSCLPECRDKKLTARSSSSLKDGAVFFALEPPDELPCPVCKRVHLEGNNKLNAMFGCSWKVPVRVRLSCWKSSSCRYEVLLHWRLGSKELAAADLAARSAGARLLEALGEGHLAPLLDVGGAIEEDPLGTYVLLSFPDAVEGDLSQEQMEEARMRVLGELGLEGDPFVQVHVVNERYLSPLHPSPDTRVLLIRSGCGTGKSDVICRYVTLRREEMGDQWKGVLSVGDRASLSQAIHQRFHDRYNGWTPGQPDPREVGLQLYNHLTTPAAWRDAQSVATTYNSLWRASPLGQPRRHFSIYLKDEVESACTYMMDANTFKKVQMSRRMALGLDRYHVSTSEVVVAADKDLSRTSVGYLRSILPSAPIGVVENVYKANRRHLYASFRSHGNFLRDRAWVRTLDLLCDQLRAGRRVFAVFTSKTELDQVRQLTKERLPDKACLFISKDSSRKERSGWSDVNSLWKDYDLVAITPAITTGADYTPEDPSDRFDCCFAFGKEGSVVARTFCQMILRARSLKTNKVFALLPTPGYPGMRYPAHTLDRLQQVVSDDLMKQFAGVVPVDLQNMLAFAWDEDGVVRFDIEDQVTELFLMTQQERVWSENDFTGQFFELWVASGGEVSVRQKEIETERQTEEETEMGTMVNVEENEKGEERARDTELDREKEKENDGEATSNSKGKEKDGERKRKGSPLEENKRGSRKKIKGTSVQQWAEPDMRQVSEQIQEDRRRRILEAPDMTLQELARLVCDPQSEEWLVWAKLKADYRDFFGQARRRISPCLRCIMTKSLASPSPGPPPTSRSRRLRCWIGWRKNRGGTCAARCWAGRTSSWWSPGGCWRIWNGSPMKWSAGSKGIDSGSSARPRV